MRSTELVNARLVTVTAATGGDDWEAAGAGGAQKWGDPGGVGVHYDETRQRTMSGDRTNITVWRSLQVREELGIDWSAGDVVTFQPDDLDAPLTAKVQAVEDPHTSRGEAGEVRLTLELV